MPAPEAVIIENNREGLLYQGTNFTLICMIFVNKTGVDTEFHVQGNLSHSESLPNEITVLNTTIADTDLQVSFDLVFYPLTSNDTGVYECSAAAHSTLPYAASSDAVRNGSEITILGK